MLQLSSSTFRLDSLRLNLNARDRRRLGQIATPLAVCTLTVLAYTFWA